MPPRKAAFFDWQDRVRIKAKSTDDLLRQMAAEAGIDPDSQESAFEYCPIFDGWFVYEGTAPLSDADKERFRRQGSPGRVYPKPETIRDVGIDALWKLAGLASVYWSFRNWSYTLHFGVEPRYWQAGYRYDPFDVGFYSFGLGPFALICWHWAHDAEGNLIGTLK